MVHYVLSRRSLVFNGWSSQTEFHESSYLSVIKMDGRVWKLLQSIQLYRYKVYGMIRKKADFVFFSGSDPIHSSDFRSSATRRGNIYFFFTKTDCSFLACLICLFSVLAGYLYLLPFCESFYTFHIFSGVFYGWQRRPLVKLLVLVSFETQLKWKPLYQFFNHSLRKVFYLNRPFSSEVSTSR